MNAQRLFFTGLSLVIAAAASAQQGWLNECIDPENTAPYSPDYATTGMGNNFIRFTMGVSGTVTHGGQNGPCFAPTARTLNASGRMAISIGGVGSVQTDFDNGMALSFGSPRDAAGDYCYVTIVKDDGSNALFGDGGLASIFTGESLRQTQAVWRDADVEAVLVARVIGDAIKYDWTLRNLGEDAAQLGLRFAMYPGLRTSGGRTDIQGHNQSLSLRNGATSIPRPTLVQGGSPYIGFIETDTTRPLQTEKNFVRSVSTNFPNYVNFQWSFAQPYGVRVDMGPTDATPDATLANQILIGNFTRTIQDNNPATRLFNDTGAGDPGVDATFDPVREDSDQSLGEASFVLTFPRQTVSAGSSRKVIHYLRSPWSNAIYVDPYAFVVDSPRIIEPTPNGGTNDLAPNPFTIAAYVDNQYAVVDRETPLQNVRYRINIPTNGGLRLADGETAEKTVPIIGANQIGAITWRVIADGNVTGVLPYSVTVSPTPGPTRTLSGSVLVSATPKVRLPEGAVLFSFPWNFSDSSLDNIFGPVTDPNALKVGRDYLAYRWEPNIGTYQPVTSVGRGEGVWLVPLSDLGQRRLNGVNVPADGNTGGLTTTLQPGWNMIGNPYPVPLPLSQITGVFEGDPTSVLTYAELVQNGLISPSLAYWSRPADDPSAGFYRFTEGVTDKLQPQVGYWVFVTSLQPIRIQWPPLFTPGLSTLNRSAAATPWRQTEKQWRLQLTARTQNGIDAENYIGVASSAQNANLNRRFDPPASPNPTVELAIASTINGRPSRLAQDLAVGTTRKTWNVQVTSHQAGDVTVNWPNINTVPRNMRLVLVDPSSNTRRDLRFGSSYTFRMDNPGTRQLQVELEPAGSQRALIGNVVVARPSRAPGAPIAINFTLSTDATTSVRILSGAGREVFSISRGRASGAGENTATWNLRDNANRAVAPGTYQVEILAETASGERVRKIVPVNVVR